jgi:hypothetical protein
METRFQTSFIPKKPAASAIGGASSPKHKHGASIFMTISTVLFILSLVGAGAVYAWKQYLLSSQDAYKQTLSTREQQFNIDLIEQLKSENVKIDLAKQLIQNHLALSQIFDIVGRLTIENVRFMSMDVTAPSAGSDGVKLSMQGYGTSLSAVAFQSDVLNQLDQYGLRKIVKNPILSNPAIGSNNTVSFGFSATIDPTSLSYENSVAPAAASALPAGQAGGGTGSATSTP